MVMLFTKALEDNDADSVTCRNFKSDLHSPKKMSEGPTLFSCGIMENDSWRDFSKNYPIRIEQPSTNIDSFWDCLQDKCQESAIWQRESSPPCAVTNLIKDLSLNDHNGNPSAPPSKRQCRSLSFSDEMSSCRSSWRPVGSKVWTPVEKRRCYSGGSVQRASNGFSTMQRSSSFSLPSRSNMFSLSYDQSGFSSRLTCQPSRGSWTSETSDQTGDIQGLEPTSVRDYMVHLPRSLSYSHEQIPLLEYCPPSASSTPASTPELTRRTNGLSRSRSQPCVLNEKKIGMKRRRQEEVQEQRPSLDFVKMTQRNFHSLSCLGIPGDDCCQQNQDSLNFTGTKKWTAQLHGSDTLTSMTPACSPAPKHQQNSEDSITSTASVRCDELDYCAIEGSCKMEDEYGSWRYRTGQDNFQLDDELDIEQIENN